MGHWKVIRSWKGNLHKWDFCLKKRNEEPPSNRNYEDKCLLFKPHSLWYGLPWWLVGKESTCNAEMWVQFLGQEDTLEKEMATHTNQYSCLGNPMDRGSWHAAAPGVTKDLDTT